MIHNNEITRGEIIMIIIMIAHLTIAIIGLLLTQ